MQVITPEVEALLARLEADLRAVIKETRSGSLCLFRRRGHLRGRAESFLSELGRAVRERLPELDFDADPPPEEQAEIEARIAEARRARFVLDARRVARKVARRS